MEEQLLGTNIGSSLTAMLRDTSIGTSEGRGKAGASLGLLGDKGDVACR